MTHNQITRTEKIRVLLLEIDESLELIHEYLPESRDFNEFVDLRIIKDGLYKRLEYVLQNIFDICAIINRDMKLGIPQNDEDIINNLINAGILDSKMGGLLKDMKGMRNILVHQYGRINDKIVFEVFMTQLDDIASICTHFEKILMDQKSDRN
jgi:uncharacterized protein YutE (UPF0331/DUF86 family)